MQYHGKGSAGACHGTLHGTCVCMWHNINCPNTVAALNTLDDDENNLLVCTRSPGYVQGVPWYVQGVPVRSMYSRNIINSLNI